MAWFVWIVEYTDWAEINDTAFLFCLYLWNSSIKVGGYLSLDLDTKNWLTDCDAPSVFTARRLAKRGICRRRVSVCVSMCLSVCVSVTLRYCIKTAKRRITQTTPHDSPMTLVFWCQRSWRNSNGITPYGGEECRWGGLKLVSFDEKRAITRKRYKIDV